jgi:hypothetical protein
MIATRRLLGLVLAVLLSATALTLPSGAHAAQVDTAVRAAKVDPVRDFPKMPRKCVDPKLLIPQKPVKCNLNGFKQNRPTLVLWGDSHAWQMIPALRGAASGRNINLVAFLMGSCPVMDPNLTREQKQSGAPACLLGNERALDFVTKLKQQKKKVHVLLGTYWQRYLHAIRKGDTKSYHGQMAAVFKTAGPRLFRTLGKLRVPVDVDGQMVTAPSNAKASCYTDRYYAFSCDLPRKKALRNEKGTKRWVKKQMRALSGHPRYVDANKMCDATTCYAKPRGTYTFWDFQHISASMSKKLSFVLDKTVTRAGGKGAPNGGGPVLGDEGGGGGGCQLIIFC